MFGGEGGEDWTEGRGWVEVGGERAGELGFVGAEDVVDYLMMGVSLGN